VRRTSLEFIRKVGILADADGDHDDWLDAISLSKGRQAESTVRCVLPPTSPADADVLGERLGVMNASRAPEDVCDARKDHDADKDGGCDERYCQDSESHRLGHLWPRLIRRGNT
jgi:hypothetical protein